MNKGLKTVLLSSLSLFAFAGNSVLCRLALAEGVIDPTSFTVVRLLAGVLALLFLIGLADRGKQTLGGKHGGGNWRNLVDANWVGPLALFVYATFFSFAYITLDTGVGALILFGSVQITMIGVSLLRGNILGPYEWLGLLLASCGLVYLVYPELSKPTFNGFVMMAIAGVAWGFYTINGQGSVTPLRDTASNFIKSLPFALILTILFIGSRHLSSQGLILAVASGAITSGVGYAIWYAALRGLKASQAGVLQLLVPIIAAAGGVVFSEETLSVRLVVAAILTLGGIALVMLSKTKRR